MKDFYWDLRPKPEYGTIELRVCGTRCRSSAPPPSEDDYLVYNYNRFQACRFGLDGTLVHPQRHEQAVLRDDILATLRRLEPQLAFREGGVGLTQGGRLQLRERDPGAGLVGLEQGDQLAEIALQPFEGGRIEAGQSVRQHAGKGQRGALEHRFTLRRDAQGHAAAVHAFARGGDQAALGQALDQVAGGRLVDVELARQLGHADGGPALDHGKRPQLGAADAGFALDLAKVGFDGIEHHAELAQHAGRGDGSLGRFGRFKALGWIGS
jgi:hypothetical protein